MKKYLTSFPVLLFVLAGLLSSCSDYERSQCVNLRCEYLSEPLAIEAQNPRFSWEIQSESSDYQQSAFEIRVSTSIKRSELAGAYTWKSGRIKGVETSQIEYQGPELKPNTTYYWTVRSWDHNMNPGDWSPPTSFHTGHNSETWMAKWIGMPVSQAEADDYSIPPSPMLRKEFELTKKVERALFTATAKGIYEAWLNGKKIGNQYLAPGWTDFEQLIQYQTYEIDDLKESSRNCISVVLADGWFAGRLGSIDFGWKNFPWRGWYGRDLRFLGQLEIWYTDGTKETIPTDESWTYYSDGPFRQADHFIGVTYDFNKEISGWMDPEFDDQDWESVVVEKPDFKRIRAQVDQPVEVVRELRPISVTSPVDGIYIVDMGQNMVGWLDVQLQGLPGDTVILKHGEMLMDNGLVYRENLRNAPQVETYILSDTVKQRIEPLFTFHGFRYVQFEGLQNPPLVADITGKVLVSATPETGSFECSNSMLNKLWENIRWTQWGNQISVPTDCPQRSERMGWMGDAQVFAQTAIFNHDMSAFYTKWGQDIIHAQFETGEFSDVSPRGMPDEPRFISAPGWADAGLIVPFRLYENYGDLKVIENHYESMKKHVDLIHSLNPDLIHINGTGHAYNDWLNGNTIISDTYPKTGGEIPKPVFNTAFWIRSTRLLAKAAELTGREDDRLKYTELADNILQKFQEEFLADDGTITGETQSGYAIALSFDLVPEELRMPVLQKLIQALAVYDNRMSTGFISTICMMDQLSEMGYHQLACQLALSTRLPSWGYSIEQGATTIWERWDAFVVGRGFQNAGMNSFNHYTFGSIGEWMYKHVLGIQPHPDYPGWRHFYIAPKMGGSLTYAKGSYHSINGPISVDWKRDLNVVNIELSIPANTSATFVMPVGYLTEVIIDGEKLSEVPVNRKVELKSGTHQVQLTGK